jgi:ATP-dependent helicase/nuclease subunit B
MPSDESSGLPDRATIVVASSLAARQWEAWLSAEAIGRGARAWLTPDVIAYRPWLEQLWLQGGPERPLPLTAAQTNALWRRLIADSAAGAELLSHGGAAEWAADAWRLLCHWRIDSARERAGSEQGD